VLLADELVECPRPQLPRERRDLVEPTSGGLVEQIAHRVAVCSRGGENSVRSDASSTGRTAQGVFVSRVPREAWDEPAYGRLTALLDPVQDELVERLEPRPGDRWLDVGDGGAIGMRAARSGAEVTVIDNAAPVAGSVRGEPERDSLPIRFDAGDAEYLPYDDASFDVISSSFGFIQTPDHASVAAELARVAKPDARLGFTAWKPNPKLGELYRRFTDEPLDGREATEWGREDHVEDMLGDEFELEFFDGTLWLEADSGEDLWKFFSATAPPVMALVRRLDGAGAEEFHRAFVELYESYRTGAGVRAPQRYLVTIGRRR
jgi:SAM-dependent methyltransferase